MISLSVCMIVKNEEAVLSRVLDCVKNFADEIIIVDTGSTDKTIKIASAYTDKIYDFKWRDDFSAARNFSFSLATKDYIMWLDADDVVPPSEQKKIIDLKSKLISLDSPDCVMCKYVLCTSPNEFSFYRERILRRVSGFIWEEPIHEVIAPRGNIIYSDITIYHKKLLPAPPKRNLKIYRKLIRKGIPLSPRALYYYSRELMFNGYYRSAIKNFRKFLSSNAWVENKIDACIMLAECYLHLSDIKHAKSSLYRSFEFGAPRAKAVCTIGQILLKEKNYSTSADWFLIATQLEQKKVGWCEPDYYEFIPYINLSVCYYYLRDFEKAKQYYNLAKAIYPDSPIIARNSKYFE